MNVAFSCPQCEASLRGPLSREQAPSCQECGREFDVQQAISAEGDLQHCAICGGRELFLRKDFSQRLGLTIIGLGFFASSIAWYLHRPYLTYAILFATALADVVLYALVGNLLECYRCHAEYRDVAGLERFEPFNLETHERHRQQKARMAEAQRSSALPVEAENSPPPAPISSPNREPV